MPRDLMLLAKHSTVAVVFERVLMDSVRVDAVQLAVFVEKTVHAPILFHGFLTLV